MRPIIFSGPMIKALLSGSKSQTRRILKPQPHFYNVWQDECSGEWFQSGHGEAGDDLLRIPYAPGDRLWVREAWRTGLAYEDLPPSAMGGDEQVLFECDGETERWWPGSSEPGRLRPSIHMPRWASRITLEVTDVRVQRLQEISADDAIAEGCYFERWITGEYPHFDQGVAADNRALVRMFRNLWESIHGPGSWDENPWCVAVTFRRAGP